MAMVTRQRNQQQRRWAVDVLNVQFKGELAQLDHYAYRCAMHNDKRNTSESPRVRRSPLNAIIATFVVLAGLLVAAVRTLWHFDMIEEIASGTVTASIPIQPVTAENAVASWTAVDAVPSSTSFIDATVTGLPATVLDSFITAEWAAFFVTMLAVLPIVAAGIGVLTARLRWSLFAILIGVAGLVITIGSLVTGQLDYDAAVRAAAAVYADEKYWLEPGFLAGIDALPVVSGMLVIFTALALARLSRFATDADGVV
ncbi:hypothetical protein A20C1_12917 [marine actinobacterium PHSC20C1]|nr:hypothetical protein A20C1_12917 [marine actinobacterium PHSC20C1]